MFGIKELRRQVGDLRRDIADAFGRIRRLEPPPPPAAGKTVSGTGGTLTFTSQPSVDIKIEGWKANGTKSYWSPGTGWITAEEWMAEQAGAKAAEAEKAAKPSTDERGLLHADVDYVNKACHADLQRPAKPTPEERIAAVEGKMKAQAAAMAEMERRMEMAVENGAYRREAIGRRLDQAEGRLLETLARIAALDEKVYNLTKSAAWANGTADAVAALNHRITALEAQAAEHLKLQQEAVKALQAMVTVAKNKAEGAERAIAELRQTVNGNAQRLKGLEAMTALLGELPTCWDHALDMMQMRLDALEKKAKPKPKGARR